MTSSAPKPIIQPLDYLTDSSIYYRAVRHLTQPIWLDSGRPFATFGRYDIITAAPKTVFSTQGNTTTIQKLSISKNITAEDGIVTETKTELSKRDPFELVGSAIMQLGQCENQSFPFTGGALGYFGYNLRAIVEPLLKPIKRDIAIPDMLIGIYEWAIIQDHEEEKSYVMTLDSMDQNKKDLILALAKNANKSFGNLKEKNNNSFIIKTIENKVKVNNYYNKINEIKDYIVAGDCYQVNFAQRFETTYTGDHFHAYQHLRQLLPAPFGCYMEFDGGAILSYSPERFLKVDNRIVETKPIKGTIARGKTKENDIENARTLLASEKDRAENLMIVDLLRNDLSKNCELGSVKTPELFKLESYANVHHLVSTVTGKLRSDSSLLELIKGCFPGGSITGTPKFRSMEIIDELETLERSIYCGSIGYLSTNGKMDSSIVIRTVVCDDEKMYCWGGGGIVADSDAESEYQESLQKVNVLLDGLKAFQA